jgi:hypothetical protein
LFDNIFAAIEKWMRELLSGMVESNLSTMFTAVNQQTSEIAAQVGQTPQGWNSSIFSMIRNISDSVVIPIAGIIITLILCYELISMLTERNNLHDVDTWMFFKYFVKMWIAVYLVSHTFDIAMAVFDIGQSVVNSSSGIIRGNTAIDISSLSMQMQAVMATMAIGELVTLALETAPNCSAQDHRLTAAAQRAVSAQVVVLVAPAVASSTTFPRKPFRMKSLQG